MSGEFADTNVILYLLDDGPKAARAEEVLSRGPRISVQVLNEAAVNCRRKAGMTWEETGAFLSGIRALCPVESLTARTHDVGRAVAARYGLSVYDAMIVAAALLAGCTTLLTEDMGDGTVIEGQLRIVNPFA
jgi:predicted nucleic acid-binding protein